MLRVLTFDFNSIKVQLERKGGLGGVDHSGHFNSIKVQLEQSHARNNSKNRDFNSIKVQLEQAACRRSEQRVVVGRCGCVGGFGQWNDIIRFCVQRH